MSEHINNQSKRKEALKQVIRQLHAGKTVEEVKGEFAALLQGVSATDIAQIEQELIEEGMKDFEARKPFQIKKSHEVALSRAQRK